MKLSKLICIIMITFMTPQIALALDINSCTPGRTVYIDDWIDVKVKIIRRDYSDNTVKVKLPDGKTKWVKAQNLMDGYDKIIEDAVEEVALKLIAHGLEELFSDK